MDLLSVLGILETWASIGKNSESCFSMVCLFAKENKRTVVKWSFQTCALLKKQSNTSNLCSQTELAICLLLSCGITSATGFML